MGIRRKKLQQKKTKDIQNRASELLKIDPPFNE
jgi:hypothetical protein